MNSITGYEPGLRSLRRFTFSLAALGLLALAAGQPTVVGADADTNAEIDYSAGLPELGDVSEMRAWFEASAGAHRLVLLLSPT